MSTREGAAAAENENTQQQQTDIAEKFFSSIIYTNIYIYTH